MVEAAHPHTMPQGEKTLPARPLRIGLQASSIDPFWVEVRETIWHACQREAASTTRYTGAPAYAIDLVEIETLPGDLEGDEFVARVEAMLALELDALIAVPASMRFIETLLENHLPVIALHHRDFAHPLFSCLPELYPSARLVCQYMLQQLHEKGRVLIVGGQQEYVRSAPSSRLQAALDLFALSPAIKWRRVPAPWDYAGAVSALQESLSEGESPFDAIFGLSDTLALAGRDVCTRLGILDDKSVIVGINGDPLAIAAIANGEMAATVATAATEIGAEALRIACLAATGAPIPPHFDYRPKLVTEENVAQAALQRLVHISDLPSRLVGANRRQEEQRVADLETSLAINHRIGSILDRDQLLSEISHLISSRYGYEEVCVYLWDADAHALVLHTTEGNQQENNQRESNQNSAKERICLPIAQASIPGRAFLRNRPVFLPNAQATWRFAADPALPQVRTRTAVPIRLGGSTTGVLDLRSMHTIQHTPIELNALQLLADQLGIGLENSRLYAEALEARAAAERADSLKTRLLTNISHELRAPLNAILGYSQAGLSEPNPYGAPLPTSLLSDLHRVQRAGRQLVQLVDDLLSLSQAEIGALEVLPEAVNMALLLENLFAEFEAMNQGAPAEKDADEVAWRLLLPADLPMVSGDPVRMRQLFLDVLSNARKYTQRGYIEVGARVEANDVFFWVADTGVGIAWEQQAQIHQAFLSAADPLSERAQPRSGLGLGLSVANHIARLHGGSLTVESAPGHGTVCHIQLPLQSLVGTSAGGSAPVRLSTVQQSGMPDSVERVLQGVLANASDMTRQIADYLVANLAATITREEIATALRVSPDYVSRIFRKETGMTPWQYLNRYRVLQAQRLLLTTDLSVTEIAAATGFNEAAYFVRIFHRETGKAPQRFRKEAASTVPETLSGPDPM